MSTCTHMYVSFKKLEMVLMRFVFFVVMSML